MTKHTLVRMNLQLFAEPELDLDGNPVFNSDVVDEPEEELEEELEDVIETEEDVDDVNTDEDDDEQNEDEDGDDDDKDTDESDEDDDEDDDSPKLFSKKQQEAVDELITARLARQERSMLKQLREHAGTELSMDEVNQSAKLWGLLKANKELNDEIAKVITNYIQTGKAKEVSSVSKAESRLAQREAILDLKLRDNTFAKYSKQILEWAEDNDYEITNEKSLKLVYTAWKASDKGVLAKANAQLKEKRKQAKEEKQQQRKRAKSQRSKGGKRKTPKNYRKMSDKDILKAEGVSLFTKE